MKKRIVAFAQADNYNIDSFSKLKEFSDFEEHSGSISFMKGKPLDLKFAKRIRVGKIENRSKLYFDMDNDVCISWQKDYCFFGGFQHVSFLFDNGDIKEFHATEFMHNEFDVSNEKPLGVYADLVEFLTDYIKNGYYDDGKMEVPDFEYTMDI